MSAIASIQTYSDNALIGAIHQLACLREWPSRLAMLKQELARREREDAESEEPSQYIENVPAVAPATLDSASSDDVMGG